MMVYVNKRGYLERKTHSGRGHGSSKGAVRNWWLIKHGTTNCNINIGQISFHSEWAGKRIRLKLEVLDE